MKNEKKLPYRHIEFIYLFVIHFVLLSVSSFKEKKNVIIIISHLFPM